MSEYAKKKNDELAALCKERGLAHTGKKADLVKRLEDHDASNSSAATAAPTTAAAPAHAAAAEDEIDWDDEPATETAKIASTETGAATIAAGGLGQVGNPQAVPNQQVGEDVTQPTAPEDGTAASSEPTAVEAEAEKEKTPVDFSAGLATATLDEEIAKRKRRAEKFGLDASKDETLKMLERAKRFGTDVMPGGLNQALPEKGERSEKKRGREGGQDGGVRKRSRQRPGMGRKERPIAAAASGGKGGVPAKGSWMTDQDREKAEKRKARFAAAAE